ncbi:MAG: sulfite exporter TauE/SafE family protein [Polyangiaceae bacterium]
MTLTLLLPIVGASVLGSVHCAAMCGPFAAMVSNSGAGRGRRLLLQLAYQGGRLLSYVALGAAAGSAGRALDLAGAAAGLGDLAAGAAGFLLLVWGLGALLETQGVRIPRLKQALPARVSAFLFSLRQSPSPWRAGLLGLATTLLPCGWLYAFVLTAASTAHAAEGALVMFALWVGNAPMLLGIGFFFGGALNRLRRHVPVFSASLIFCIGLSTIITRTRLPSFALLAPQLHGSLGRAPSLADCPCHRKHR